MPIATHTPPTKKNRVKGNDRVPACVDRSFREQQKTRQQLALQSSNAQVSGGQLYKFHRQPLPPAGVDAASYRIAAQLAFLRVAPQPPPVQPLPPVPVPPAREVGTQSDYRESEVQTLPWTPQYVLLRQQQQQQQQQQSALAQLSQLEPKQAAMSAAQHCSGPEVLTLAGLKWGDGLPGGCLGGFEGMAAAVADPCNPLTPHHHARP